ncbi:helix-turn-helix domain-containing protein [Nocardia grenadensis]
MAEKKNPLGATGETVAANVERLRQQRNLSYAELSRRLEAAGRPIPTLGLRKIESKERRVDVDDLVVLATVFEVAPLALLMPQSSERAQEVHVSGRSDTAIQIFQWLRGDALPNAYEDPAKQFQFMIDSRPRWAVSEVLRKEDPNRGDD